MELFDIYDKNRDLTGKKVTGYNEMVEGEYRMVVDVILVNSQNQFLIQKRTANKSYCPNMWGLTGGSVDAGEDSLTAIIRETQEEIGLMLTSEELELFHKDYGRDQPILVDVWLVYKEVKIEDLKLQPEEVCDVKWADISELREMFAQQQFMPTLVPFVEKGIAQMS